MLSNTATVTVPGGAIDPNAANNSATDTDTLTAMADLSITKTDGVTTAVPGGSVTYTITASNSGPSNAPGATVADTFPASLTGTWTCVGAGGGTCTASGSGNINDTVNLPAGGSVTYTVSATISASATGSLSNTAMVTAQGGVADPNSANNSATDTDTLSPQADLAITKTDGVTTVNAGGSVTYTITASNAGPSNAPGSTVADTFPASLTGTWTCVGAGGGTCTASGSGNINDTVNLPSGGSVTYTVNATLSAAATGSLVNTATVSTGGGVTDPTAGNNSATDTDTITSQADLSITKTDGVTTAVPGGSVTYTIVASNSGPSNAVGATVADTFPAILTATWTCVGAGGGTCTASGAGNINDTVNLPVGGSVTYTATAAISAAATGSLSNTATVTAPAGTTDPSAGNNSATDTDTLSPQADLAITKTDGVTTAVPGGSVTYTITASNAGPSNAPGSTVADTFPASLTGTWTCVGAGGGTCTAAGAGNINDTVNLPAGGSVTYTVTAAISPAATGMLSNTATVATGGGVTDPTPGNNSATDTDTLTPQADLSITKTDGAASAIPGTSVTYTITASNSGPSSAPGSTVADTFPATITGVTWTCVGAGGGTCTASGSGNINDTVNLPVGGSVTYTATGTISASASGTVSNTATVTAAGGVTDPTPGNNSATDTDTLTPQADLALTKTASPDPVVVTNNITYTIGFTNNGPSDAQTVTVTDAVPANTTFVSAAVTTGTGWMTTTPSVGGTGDVVFSKATVAAGQTATFTVVVNVNAGTLHNTIVTNTATAASATTDPTPGNNSATATVTVLAQADLTITKTDGSATAVPGTSVTYTITASNAGPSTAVGSTVADTFPASITGVTWTCTGAGGGACTASGSGNINDTVDIPVGGSVTYTATGTLSAGATGTLSNTATVAPPTGITDPNLADNTATDTDTITPQADLSVTKTDGAATAIPGTSITYTITASNAGPSNAPGTTVADTFPATITGATWTCVGAGGGTCTASGSGNINDTANLPAGGSVTYTATGTISASASGTLSNTATVTAAAGVTDPTPGNNSATDTDTLTPQADLSVTKAASPDPVVVENNITYTIDFTNNGQSDAQTVTVTDAVPANTTFVSAAVTTGTGWTTTAPAIGATGNVVFSKATVAAGQTATFSIVVNVNAGTLHGTIISNTATAASATNDPFPANNSSTATVSVYVFPTIQFASVAYMEDESQTAVITIERTGDPTGTDTAMFSTSNGTAMGGAACTTDIDYISVVNQLVTFNPGDMQKTVNVPICGDAITEPDQTVNLSLTSAIIGVPDNALLTINDTASRFRNNTNIDIIPGGTANPYPSQIVVTGGPAIIGSIRVSVYDYQADTPDNVAFLLVGPTGQSFVLMANAGGTTPGGPVTLNFTDTAGVVIPNDGPLLTVDYEPTTWGAVGAFAPPAPPPPYSLPGSTVGGVGMQTFYGNYGGTNSNGTWSLYVREQAPTANTPTGLAGNIAGGWGIEFLTTTAANATISGRVLTADGRPIRNARVIISGNSLEQPITVTTGSLGWYSFDGLATGETYVLTVNSKRFTFTTPSQVINLVNNVVDADFVAEPLE